MRLYEGQTLTYEQLAAWFGLKTNSFRPLRNAKLEELKDFCDYELCLSPKGQLKSVIIKEVYCDTYCSNKLKKDFLQWLDAGGLETVADLGGDNIISYPTVVNYYCSLHGIEYDGAHYKWVEEEGRTLDLRRKIEGTYREENKHYAEWHYLYRQLKKYCIGKNLISKEWVDCCAIGFNPTYLRRTRDQERKIRDAVYREVFGPLKYTEVLELVQTIEDSDSKDEILETKLMRSWCDKEKRLYAARKCAELGVLFRKGYELQRIRREDYVEGETDL